MSTSKSRLRAGNIAQVPVQWDSRNNISTFVRCLHLLDFNLLRDWPQVSELTFSTRSAQQNIQQRQRAVEWSLYRLFETYDSGHTKEKLQPFFPPLTQLQSLNLRAALLRSLTELKKNGVLGRDIILRKTMLDECKGNRFDDLLAAFAMLVLRRRLSQTKSLNHVAEVVQQYEDQSDDQLMPLIIAHRAVMHSQLRKREGIRENSRICRDMIEEHSAHMHSRKETLHQLSEDLDSQQHVRATTLLYEEWLGDIRWIPEVLHGGLRLPNLPVIPSIAGIKFQAPKSSSLQEAEPTLLIAELDSRIETHQKRLLRWQDICNSLPVIGGPEGMNKNQATLKAIPDIHFNKHQELNWVRVSKNSESNGIPAQGLESKYANLLKQLEEDLNSRPARGDQTKARRPDQSVELRSNAIIHEPNSPLQRGSATSVDHISETKVGLSFDKGSRLFSPVVEEPTLLQSMAPVPITSTDVNGTHTRSLVSDLEMHNVTEVQDNETNKAESSPVHNVSQENYGSNEDDTSPNLENKNFGRAPEHHKLERVSLDRNNATLGLLERTRRSMAMLSTPQTKTASNKFKDKRESQIYPVNQFETPRSSKTVTRGSTPASGTATPRDKLFEEGADYASIFKSRPKIAISPVASPERRSTDSEKWIDEGLGKLNLDSNS